MEFRFDVWELQEALIAQAAVNAVVVEMQRQAAEKKADKENGDDCSCIVVHPTPLEQLLPVVNAQVSSLETQTAQFTKEQIKAAAKFSDELAALISKKGRKTAEEQARIYALTALAQLHDRDQPTDLVGTDYPIGAEFIGATAEQLQTILEATTDVVSSTESVQVRSLPSFLDDGNASTQGVDEPVEPENSFADLADGELYKKITDAAEGGLGFMWFKNVVDRGGGVMNKMSRDHMIAVLTNPDEYAS